MLNGIVYVNIVSSLLQGSVLGPCLFNLYVEDLSAILTNCLFYADDLKVWHSEPVALQSDLDTLSEWAEQNALPLNPMKCAVLPIRRTQLSQSYTLCGNALRTVNSIRDLGIHVESSLKCDEHTQRISSSSKKVRSRI